MHYICQCLNKKNSLWPFFKGNRPTSSVWSDTPIWSACKSVWPARPRAVWSTTWSVSNPEATSCWTVWSVEICIIIPLLFANAISVGYYLTTFWIRDDTNLSQQTRLLCMTCDDSFCKNRGVWSAFQQFRLQIISTKTQTGFFSPYTCKYESPQDVQIYI